MNTILFDLDGTLTDIDYRGAFLDGFFLLAPLFGLPPWRSYFALKAALKALKHHDPDETNQEAFVRTMAEHSRTTPARIEELLKAFEQQFYRMGRHFRPVTGARETLLRAQELGYALALATNPKTTLPMVLQRLEWGGVGDIPFRFVTHSGNMTTCKPSPDYYAEILRKWGLHSEDCLMVGNDPEKDLAAQEVGIKCFLLQDRVKTSKKSRRADYEGDHPSLLCLLEAWQKSGIEAK